MKNYRDWMLEWGRLLDGGHWSPGAAAEFIKTIQADALRHAAGVAEKICNQRDRLVTGKLIGDTLLAEADKLTKP